MITDDSEVLPVQALITFGLVVFHSLSERTQRKHAYFINLK